MARAWEEDGQCILDCYLYDNHHLSCIDYSNRLRRRCIMYWAGPCYKISGFLNNMVLSSVILNRVTLRDDEEESESSIIIQIPQSCYMYLFVVVLQPWLFTKKCLFHLHRKLHVCINIHIICTFKCAHHKLGKSTWRWCNYVFNVGFI